MAAGILPPVLARSRNQLRVAHQSTARVVPLVSFLFRIAGASWRRYREIRRSLDAAALSICAGRGLFLPRLSVVHADYRHRVLACGRRQFVSDGRGALLQSWWTRPWASLGHALLFGNVPGAEKDGRSLDAARYSLGLELGRGLLFRCAIKRTSRTRAFLKCQLAWPRLAHRWSIRAGGRMAEYPAARDLVVRLLRVAAGSEISEPSRDPRSPATYRGIEDSVVIMTKRSL